MSRSAFWTGKRVFLTGHTGFKGSWLSLWLHRLGADVHGFALSPPTEPSLFEAADIAGLIAGHTIGDVRDGDALHTAMAKADPQIVIHMAAQPLVRYSYAAPVETYAVNVMGTANLLEAARKLGSVSALVNVTTDKCYEKIANGIGAIAKPKQWAATTLIRAARPVRNSSPRLIARPSTARVVPGSPARARAM